ncbi:hypothetical protein QQF64_031268 [Cirrhinus molitorella]|uniref:Uncharacterized protein n=1 Tax=Cirrhinus molitorella TaxID=172907 RepID=A0ABR3MWJ3_9TELE
MEATCGLYAAQRENAAVRRGEIAETLLLRPAHLSSDQWASSASRCNRTHIRSERRWVHIIITPPAEPKAHELTDDPRAPSSIPHFRMTECDARVRNAAAQTTIIDRSADIHTTDRRSWTSQHLLHCLTSAASPLIQIQEPSSKVMADRYAVYWNRTNPR